MSNLSGFRENGKKRRNKIILKPNISFLPIWQEVTKLNFKNPVGYLSQIWKVPNIFLVFFTMMIRVHCAEVRTVNLCYSIKGTVKTKTATNTILLHYQFVQPGDIY